jgi:hypothetical protein
MVRYTYWAVVVLSLTLSLSPGTSHAVPIITAGSATVSVGDTFTVSISIADAVDLTSFQFDLSFNATILQVTATGVTENPFFTQSDITVFNPGAVDNTNGQILGVSDALIFQAPVNGTGTLVNIEFQAIALGMSPLTLSNVLLNLSDQGFVTAPGAAPVPEPSTLSLLGGGLAAWSLYRGAVRGRRRRVAQAMRPR